jgi:D-glycero-D-manno-heptose 1,7-bisphosphate phosphatase
MDLETLDAIHARMHQLLSRVGGHIDGLFICPHETGTECSCRKPGRALLDEISRRFLTPLDQAHLIGDDLADIQVATEVGCPPILVRTGRGMATLAALPENANVQVAENLAHAVELLLHP